MPVFTYTTQQVPDSQGTYEIIWYKGEGETKQELCSGFVTLSGTDEGIASALAFAANDVRVAHPDLFVEDVPEEFMAETFMEENQDV